MTRQSCRRLTSGETSLASRIFRDAIDYEAVRIYRRRYLPFPLQGRDTAMAPNGCIYFPYRHFKEDFSQESSSDQMWFIHEMTHVWQRALGYRVRCNGLKLALRGEYAAGATARDAWELEEGRSLSDLNMEQQATAIERYFGAAVLGREELAGTLPFLLAILRGFLENPKDARLLPR